MFNYHSYLMDNHKNAKAEEATKVQHSTSKVQKFWNSFKCLYNLSKEELDAFFESYELFDDERVNEHNEKLIVSWYHVINYLCSLGEVEKMYIPPVMDPNMSVFENQNEYERKIMSYIDAGEGKSFLELGCGRGRVAAHVVTHTNSKVTGINIDPTQLSLARENAERLGITDKLNFILQSFNDPYPFEDETFDGIYEVQALSYTKNMDTLFKEWYRVLKPGAKVSILDWFLYDKFDKTNEEHMELLKRCKPMIGAVYNPTTEEMCKALENNGFRILVNENASIDGKQYQLIEKADTYFRTMHSFVKFVVSINLLPDHFLKLFDRFIKDADSFITGDKLGLWTSCHQIVAVKPE